MTRQNPEQPNVQIGLDDQRSILHQLYSVAIDTAHTTKQLGRTWEVLRQEEERADFLRAQRRQERQNQ